MKKKRIIYPIAALLCLILSLWAAGRLLEPKHMDESIDGALISEYYAEADEGREHAVIFLGDCEVYESFVPPFLWEKYGITSFVRGSPGQTVWQSYYLLSEMLEYERPQAVVLNVYALRYGERQSEVYNRLTLDGMRWSAHKAGAIKASVGEGESYLSYLLPILRYHDRWQETSHDDLKYFFSRESVSHNGYLLRAGVVPMTEVSDGGLIADVSLPRRSMEYLDAIKALCDGVGAELILVKAPTNTWRYWWYDEWDRQVSEYATRNRIGYYNFIGDGSVGIDWQKDSYDGGFHLNVFGAEKLTERFGEILVSDYGLESLEDDPEVAKLWDGKLEKYLAERQLAIAAEE